MPAYIAFEGGEGSGKSTQAALLAKRLDAVLTREPGGTDLGKRLRELLLDADTIGLSPRAEALMMAADRAQHLDEVVVPSLVAGHHVVSDRSAYSSMAYQGGGRELGLETIRVLNELAVGGRWPDLVVMLRVDREVASGRLDRALDRFEREDEAFHHRVATAFDQMAADDPDRWLVVDGQGTVAEVADRLWSALQPRLAPFAG